MLRELCYTDPTGYLKFVGLRFADGKPQVVFPRGFAISDTDEEVRRDILSLLAVINRFAKKQEGFDPAGAVGVSLDFPFISYQYVIQDFLRNGYYNENEIRYSVSDTGTVSWSKTIQRVHPYVDGSNVVYLQMVTRQNRIKEDSLFTRIHEYCVYESFLKLGWLFTGSALLPQKPVIPFNKGLFVSVIRQKLDQTFNDSHRKLMRCMLNIINNTPEAATDSSDFSFGVSEFDGVWERLIDYVFGIADKERYFPQSTWHILRNGKFSTYPNSHLYPDTIMLYDGKTYILDAKNYKFGLTAFVDHLPATDSVQKQITYGNYVVTKGLADSDHLYNAFLLPYCKDESDELPYKFVSVATADWIKYTADTEKYKYILAILVDTRHLITTYARLNASECFALADLIEKSVDQYLNQYFHAGVE